MKKCGIFLNKMCHFCRLCHFLLKKLSFSSIVSSFWLNVSLCHATSNCVIVTQNVSVWRPWRRGQSYQNFQGWLVYIKINPSKSSWFFLTRFENNKKFNVELSNYGPKNHMMRKHIQNFIKFQKGVQKGENFRKFSYS